MTTHLEEIPRIQGHEPTAAEAARADLAVLSQRLEDLTRHLVLAQMLKDSGCYPIERIRHGSDFRYVGLDLDNPTKDELLALARELTSFGYHIQRTYDCEELQCRFYEYGTIVVMAKFTKPGSACRFVQVGEVMKPVMKFQCEGGEL